MTRWSLLFFIIWYAYAVKNVFFIKFHTSLNYIICTSFCCPWWLTDGGYVLQNMCYSIRFKIACLGNSIHAQIGLLKSIGCSVCLTSSNRNLHTPLPLYLFLIWAFPGCLLSRWASEHRVRFLNFSSSLSMVVGISSLILECLLRYKNI